MIAQLAMLLLLFIFCHTENSTTISGPANSLNTATVIIASILSPLAPLIIMVYVVGVLSGCFCQKYKQSYRRHPSSNGETNEASGEITPVYKEARLSTDKSAGTEQQEQSLDMTENIAYGPLKSNACTDNL